MTTFFPTVGPTIKSRSKPVVKNLAAWVLVITGLLAPVGAQTVEVTQVGQWVGEPLGEVLDVAISGNYAYLPSGGLQVIDISNPTNLVRVGINSSGSGKSIAVSGNYAYVAGPSGFNDSLLHVIDISNPTNPVVVGGTNTSGSANDVAVSGNYAYVVGSGGGGLELIDISNPTNPVRVGGTNTSGAGRSVAISGNYAYVGAGFSLQVFDVSNPTNPLSVGATNIGGSPVSVAIVGNYAYVADGGVGGLVVVDISNPANPVVVGGASTSGSVRALAVAGNYAYVAASSASLQVVDISDPTNPVTLGGSDNTYAYSVAVSGNYAYVGSYFAMRVIDISNPANLVAVGGFGTGDSTLSVALSGNYAYLANSSSGLEVIDINNVAAPVRVGGYYSGGYAQDVAVSGNYAYVADDDEGLQVINISNPAAPARVGGYVTSSSAKHIAVSGNHAYVARDDGYAVRMDVLDISIPTNPVRTATYSVANPPITCDYHAGGIALSGNYVYLSYGGQEYRHAYGDTFACATAGGIDVINVSDPANPVRQGGFFTSYYRNFGLAVSGNFLYVADGSTTPTSPTTSITFGGLAVYSISNQTNLAFVGAYSTNFWASDVAVSGKHVYLSPGFQVIDVSNPSNPVRVGNYVISAVGITASGDYAYVASGDSGLQILCINCPSLSAELLADCLVLRWPTNATNYMLESTLSLAVPVWQTISGTPQVQGGFYLLSMPATNTAAFFRLRRP